MKNKKLYYKIAAVCICTAMATGCAQAANKAGASDAVLETTQGMTAKEVAVTFDDEEVIDWETQEYTSIDVGNSNTVIDTSGIYVLTGTLEDGCVTVETGAEDTGIVYLVLNNVSIGSSTTAPVYVKEAQKVVMILAEGTVNTVTQGADIVTDEKDNPSGAVFSKADLTITGNGTLSVTTEFNDGITGKDELKITGGTIKVTAVGDGIVGKDLLAVETGDITVTAGKDGLRSSNDTDETLGNITISDGAFHITAECDAIQAEHVLQIDGGTFDLSSGGGYPGNSIKEAETGMGGEMRGGRGGVMGTEPDQASVQPDMQTAPPEGTPPQPESQTQITGKESVETSDEDAATTESRKALKAGTSLIVNGGNFTIVSYEDAVHSNGDVVINGGIWQIEAGDDGIHADNLVTIMAGQIDILNSYEGVEGNDITIEDGTISVVSSDDGVNVSSQTGTLTINGGNITVKAGGDGLDSNGNIVQNGGTVQIDTAAIGAGDTPVDYDGTFTTNGGSLVDENGTAIDYEAEGSRMGHGGGMGGTKRERPSAETGTEVITEETTEGA